MFFNGLFVAAGIGIYLKSNLVQALKSLTALKREKYEKSAEDKPVNFFWVCEFSKSFNDVLKTFQEPLGVFVLSRIPTEHRGSPHTSP